MPDELRHPTKRPVQPYRATPLTNSIPLDEESGLPKPFAHHSAGATNGHANGYGGWEGDDDLDEHGRSDAESLADEAKMYGPGGDSGGLPRPGSLQREKSAQRRE